MKNNSVLAFSLLSLVVIIGVAFAATTSHQEGLGFLDGRDHRYEIENDTDQSASLVALNEYPDGVAIGSEWSFAPGESHRHFYADCLYLIDENNQEVRSFEGDDDMDVVLRLEDGSRGLFV